MLIKELEDMMALVGALPREDQLRCVQALWSCVEEWEERYQEPHLSDDEWAELKRQRAKAKRERDELRAFEEMGMNIEARSGFVESFDRNKGYGYIQMEDGERALLHITCLRAGGYRDANVGAQVEFMALRRAKGWQAFRILLLAAG